MASTAISCFLAVVLTIGCSHQKVPPFTIVVLPDTQNYSERLPQYFHDQTQWISQNVKGLNISFVSHVGDIVQRGDQVIEEWLVAKKSHVPT